MRSKIYEILTCLPALFATMAAPAQTLTLQECRQMAVSGSSRTRNAALDLLSASEQRKEARWAYLPTASINAGIFKAFNPMLEITLKDVLGNSDMANNLISNLESAAFSYGIEPVYRSLSNGTIAIMTVAQPLYAGGRIINSNRLARLGYESASLKKGISEREICGEVDANYWQAVSLEEKKVALQQAIALVENICSDVRAAKEAGLATQTDLMTAEQKLIALRSDQARLESGILLSKMNLCNLIGQDYTVLKAGVPGDRPYVGDIALAAGELQELSAPENYYHDEQDIFSSMEETQLLALARDANVLQKKIAVGETLPQLSVGASYGYNDVLNHKALNGMVYVMLRIPITDWGANSHKIRRLEYDVQKASNDREYLSGQLLLNVRKLWMDAENAWQQLAAGEQVVSIAESRLSAVQADVDAGRATLTELLQAQTSLLQARQDLTDSRAAYILAIEKYRRMSGAD